ncbi:MAG TPA: secretion system protein E [Rhodospirillaceae bacterium]|nr:secretion system protein E [Rhodospirillaceae bacterium]
MLKDINAKDIYLGKAEAWISGITGDHDPIPAPDHCLEELDELRAMCAAASLESSREEFSIRHHGASYRVSTLNSLSDTIYVLRCMPASVPGIDELNIHPGYVSQLMKPGLSGLIVIAGAFAQGKTTTASAIIASRLRHHGGVAITIEDPPEMPLEGKHGQGICYQTWVNQGQFGEACRKTARYAPNMIFLGEVRDAETAAEALRASINGRLVICTTHADSVPTAIERLYSLANGVTGNSDDTSSLLASGLLCILHQRLEGRIKRPKIEFLWMGDEENHGVKNTIRLRRFDQVGSEITLQFNRMLMSARPSPPLQNAAGNVMEADRRSIPRER